MSEMEVGVAWIAAGAMGAMGAGLGLAAVVPDEPKFSQNVPNAPEAQTDESTATPTLDSQSAGDVEN